MRLCAKGLAAALVAVMLCPAPTLAYTPERNLGTFLPTLRDDLRELAGELRELAAAVRFVQDHNLEALALLGVVWGLSFLPRQRLKALFGYPVWRPEQLARDLETIKAHQRWLIEEWLKRVAGR